MKALVIGGSSWDTLIHVPEIKEIKDDMSLWANRVVETVGGTGAGKALALSSLGVEVTLITDLGKDKYREKILDFLTNNNINVIKLETDKSTAHTNLMHSKEKRISVFTSYPEIDPPFYEEVSTLLDEVDFVFLNINNFCRKYITVVKQAKKPILVDIHDYDPPNPYHQDFIDAADYLVGSAIHISNQKLFLDQMILKGKNLVVLTNSSKGIYAKDWKNNYYNLPGYTNFKYVDSNGAGDSFCAGLMLYLFETKNTGKSLEFANLCGAISCTSDNLFDTNYNKEKIEEILQKNKS